MKQLSEFILEGRENKISESEAYSWLHKIYQHVHLTRDQAIESLSWMRDDLKVLQGFERYLISIDDTNSAWVYMASDDDFLEKDKIDDIIKRLADYIVEKLN